MPKVGCYYCFDCDIEKSDENHYNNLGDGSSTGVRLVFDPMEKNSSEFLSVTHVACCFSFSVCVVNNRQVRLSGQDWIDAQTDLNWSHVAHTSKLDIKQISGGNFHFVCLLEDFTFLVAGSHSQNQTIGQVTTNGFQYVSLNDSIPKYVSCSSNRTLVETVDGYFKLFGSNSISSQTQNGSCLTIPEYCNFKKDFDMFPTSVLMFRESFVFRLKSNPFKLMVLTDKNSHSVCDLTEYFSVTDILNDRVGIGSNTTSLVLYLSNNERMSILGIKAFSLLSRPGVPLSDITIM